MPQHLKTKHDSNDAAPQTDIDPTAGKSVAEIFGEIVWLMSQDKTARNLAIADLEHLVMPAILLRQFHITYAPSPGNVRKNGDINSVSDLQPIAVKLIAHCSDAVAAAIDGDRNRQIKLTIRDWHSGAHQRVVGEYKISK